VYGHGSQNNLSYLPEVNGTIQPLCGESTRNLYPCVNFRNSKRKNQDFSGDFSSKSAQGCLNIESLQPLVFFGRLDLAACHPAVTLNTPIN
jgi:hypothetical protein